jgi:hypothetical protein
LAVRINWGTRADFEYSLSGSPREQVVPIDDMDEEDRQEEDDGEDNDDDEHGEGETERATIV